MDSGGGGGGGGLYLYREEDKYGKNKKRNTQHKKLGQN